MSFISTQDITFISLISSLISFAIAIIFSTIVIRETKKTREFMETNDTITLLREFNERQKHLERMIIDQRIKQEVLELRLGKGGLSLFRGRPPNQTTSSRIVPNFEELKQESFDSAPEELRNTENKYVQAEEIPKRDQTILGVLQSLESVKNGMTAHEIQQKIGRSREHTARLMNNLYRQGLVSRGVNARPFVYSLTENGQEVLRH